MADLTVITGANRGIGLALCQCLQARGETVLAACRQRSTELDALGVEIVEGVDVTQLAGRQRLRDTVGDRSISILINNAGIWCEDALGDMDAARLHEAYSANAVAPLLLTDLLLDAMAAGTKIAFITSRMGSIADNGSGGRYGYRMSKAALNAAGKSLAIDLKPRGIAVAILHPGFVQTRMVDFGGDVTPTQSAKGLIQRIDELNLSNTGTFWHAQGQILPW